MSNIIRVNRDRENPYAVILKAVFEDNNLSWAARGVMGYLLTKPDGWQVRFWDLINQGNLKRDAMQKILKDLQTHGYMFRSRIQDDQGRFEWVSEIYENPDMNPHYPPLPENPVMDEPLPDFPLTDEPSTGEPLTENTVIYKVSSKVSTEYSNNRTSENSYPAAAAAAQNHQNGDSPSVTTNITLDTENEPPSDEEPLELVHWSTMGVSFDRQVVENFAFEMTEMFDWRNAWECIEELDGRQLIHLIMWLQYCSDNYEELSADFDGNIKNLAGYIRTSLSNPPKMGSKKRDELVARLCNRGRAEI